MAILCEGQNTGNRTGRQQPYPSHGIGGNDESVIRVIREVNPILRDNVGDAGGGGGGQTMEVFANTSINSWTKASD